MAPKIHTLSIRLNAEDYKSVLAAAKYSQQTVREWIESMCYTATRD